MTERRTFPRPLICSRPSPQVEERAGRTCHPPRCSLHWRGSGQERCCRKIIWQKPKVKSGLWWLQHLWKLLFVFIYLLIKKNLCSCEIIPILTFGLLGRLWSPVSSGKSWGFSHWSAWTLDSAPPSSASSESFHIREKCHKNIQTHAQLFSKAEYILMNEDTFLQ